MIYFPTFYCFKEVCVETLEVLDKTQKKGDVCKKVKPSEIKRIEGPFWGYEGRLSNFSGVGLFPLHEKPCHWVLLGVMEFEQGTLIELSVLDSISFGTLGQEAKIRQEFRNRCEWIEESVPCHYIKCDGQVFLVVAV